MGDFKVKLCSLCLTPINDTNYVVVEDVITEALSFPLLKLDLNNSNEYITCNVCSSKLNTALQFKATCLDTNNTIFPYIDGTKSLPMDLKEIYMMEKENKHVSDDAKICRLCMQPIGIASEFKSIEEEEVNMIQKLIPDVNIFVIHEPVVCTHCLDSLEVHYNFLKKCSDVKQEIGNISNGHISLVSLDAPVKIEEVDIKTEDLQDPNKCDYMDINYDGIKTESDVVDQEICSPSAACLPPMKSETCNYETKIKSRLKRHTLTHKDSSEVQMYKCEICNFQTKNKIYLKKHRLIHKDVLKVREYKCDTCNYKTMEKRHLNIHMLIHKEVPTYKCETCNFETKYKKSLKQHMLLHRKASELQMYKCETCNYESKRKRQIKQHMLVHKDPSETEMYTCYSCIYETKRKSCLKKHMERHHKNIEVATTDHVFYIDIIRNN